MIGSRWHGFRKRKSCLTSLIAFYYVPSSVDEKKAADVIFLTFGKAFSRSDKLRKHGLDSVSQMSELLGSDGCGPWYKGQLVYPQGCYESRTV